MPYFKTSDNIVAWLDDDQPESVLPPGSVPIPKAAADALRKRAPVAPTSVTPRQARLALLDAGLLPAVEAAIAAMPGPAKAKAEIEWKYATTVERNSPLVASLAGALGLNAAALDALFTAAAVL